MATGTLGGASPFLSCEFVVEVIDGWNDKSKESWSATSSATASVSYFCPLFAWPAFVPNKSPLWCSLESIAHTLAEDKPGSDGEDLESLGRPQKPSSCIDASVNPNQPRDVCPVCSCKSSNAIRWHWGIYRHADAFYFKRTTFLW